MLVSIPLKYSVSQIMGYLKGKSSLMIYEKYAEYLRSKYGNRYFSVPGYYVSTVGRNRRAIEEYIKNQLQEDYTDDQLSIKEFVDPFTGEPGLRRQINKSPFRGSPGEAARLADFSTSL